MADVPSFSFQRILILIVIAIVDVFLLRYAVRSHLQFPFSLPASVQEKVDKIFPESPVIPPIRLENNLELSQASWVGSIVYGKLTNHGDVTLVSPTVFFNLSSDRDGSSYLASYLATISAKIEPQKSVYFSQRFSTPTKKEFWWSATISTVASDSGQPVPKIPKGQQVLTTPIKIPTVQTQPTDSGPWGVAKQIDAVTWTMKVGEDERIGTPQEIYQALNEYRNAHGSPRLEWDPTLATYATERATYLNSIKTTDQHKGFKDYVSDENNVRHLGFWSLGENSGYGHKLLGVHLIEWVYAGDPGHNENQLSKSWSHVGIGVTGLGVAFIFGGNKI